MRLSDKHKKCNHIMYESLNSLNEKMTLDRKTLKVKDRQKLKQICICIVYTFLCKALLLSLISKKDKLVAPLGERMPD